MTEASSHKLRWVRVRKSSPCPICGRGDYCTVAPEAGKVHCMRIDSGTPAKGSAGGWIHAAGFTPSEMVKAKLAAAKDEADKLSVDEVKAFVRRCIDDCPRSFWPELTKDTDLIPRAIEDLRVGWSVKHRAWTFPMRNQRGEFIGVRLRPRQGKKYSLRGGSEGLFMPIGWNDAPRGKLFVCEGPTDVGAMLAMGFQNTIGRPCALGGAPLILKCLPQVEPSIIVIVADRDEADKRGVKAGIKGAEILREHLAGAGYAAVIIQPPEGIKDVRDWRKAGCERIDIVEAVAAARESKSGNP